MFACLPCRTSLEQVQSEITSRTQRRRCARAGRCSEDPERAGGDAQRRKKTARAEGGSKSASRPYRIEEQIGYLLRRAHQRASAIFQTTIGDPNITPTQYSSMVKLHEYTELSQNLLGRLVGMDKATMQGVVRRLKDRGLVDSRPDPGDARRTLLSLTTRRPAPGHQAADQRPRGVARDAEAAQRPGAASAPRAAVQDHLSADLRRIFGLAYDLQGAYGIVRTRTIWVTYLRPHRLDEALSALARPHGRCWPAAPISIRRGSAGRSTRTCSTSRHRRAARHPPDRDGLAHRRPHDLERADRGRPAAAVRRAEAGGARGRRRQIQNAGTRRRQSLQRLAGRRRRAAAAGARRRGRARRRAPAARRLPLAAVHHRQPPHRAGAGRAGHRDPSCRRPPARRAQRLPQARRAALPRDLDRHGRGDARGRRTARVAARARSRSAPARRWRSGCRRSRRRCVGAPLDARSPSCVEAAHLAPLSPIDDVRGSAAYRRDAARRRCCAALLARLRRA